MAAHALNARRGRFEDVAPAALEKRWSRAVAVQQSLHRCSRHNRFIYARGGEPELFGQDALGRDFHQRLLPRSEAREEMPQPDAWTTHGYPLYAWEFVPDDLCIECRDRYEWYDHLGHTESLPQNPHDLLMDLREALVTRDLTKLQLQAFHLLIQCHEVLELAPKSLLGSCHRHIFLDIPGACPTCAVLDPDPRNEETWSCAGECHRCPDGITLARSGLRDTLLVAAARFGRATTVEALQQLTAVGEMHCGIRDPSGCWNEPMGRNAPSAYGETPLLAACLGGHAQVVRLLLREARNADVEDVSEALGIGSYHQRQCTCGPAVRGCVCCAGYDLLPTDELLSIKGMKPRVLKDMCSYRHPKLVCNVVISSGGATMSFAFVGALEAAVLDEAAQAWSIAATDDRGANQEVRRPTDFQRLDVVRSLFEENWVQGYDEERKLDVQVEPSFIAASLGSNAIPLYLAVTKDFSQCTEQRVEMVRLLLQHDADPNSACIDLGGQPKLGGGMQTMLMAACAAAHTLCPSAAPALAMAHCAGVRALLTARANPDAVSNCAAQTPIEYAESCGNSYLLELLRGQQAATRSPPDARADADPPTEALVDVPATSAATSAPAPADVDASQATTVATAPAATADPAPSQDHAAASSPPPGKKRRRNTPMAERASRLGLKLAAVPAAEDCKDQESKTARRKIQTGNQKIIERAEAQQGQQLKQWGGGEVSDEDSFEESTTPDGQVSGGEGTAADQAELAEALSTSTPEWQRAFYERARERAVEFDLPDPSGMSYYELAGTTYDETYGDDLD